MRIGYKLCFSRTYCLFLLLLFLAFCLAVPVHSSSGEARSYKYLLKTAKKDVDSVNFFELRIAYTNSSGYNPYSSKWDKQKDKINKAFAKENYEETIKQAKKLYRKKYLDIDANSALAFCYKKVDSLELHEYHQSILDNIINSILASGDGKSEETAYIVINIDEEYMILRALSLQLQMQSLHHKNGNSFDVMKVDNPESGESTEIYFNITLPWSKIEKAYGR